MEAKLAGKTGKPHFHIQLGVDDTHYRVAVNVMSDRSPSELLFFLDGDFHHALLASLPGLADGYTAIPSRADGLALDFVRGDLFRPEAMTVVPVDAPGPDNDLAEIFGLHVRQAIDAEARIYAFGSKWGPETDVADEYFLFKPGRGLHDIHLNQGSPGHHAGDNGSWQDGALFIHFHAEDRWLAFFLAFQSQLALTDDDGNPLPGSPAFGPPRGPTP